MGPHQSFLNSINFKVYQKLRQTKRPLTTTTVRSRELKTSPSHKPVNMPLVVPDVSDNERASWEAKLLGKKLTDSTSNNVSFAMKDLPAVHRVIKPGMAMTMDYKPDRLNVHVDEDGTVTGVVYG
ncbi:peptidase inhibitor I78 family protein, nitrosative stress-induced transcript [Histoplasma capsulatum var. duboisii H88]|uniref:Peptidase inhibitor I78 family protein, nitrosative stress-induced transcript n=4 Tax=Ajellomyces capsulatus TaxID=5037 RepID=A0A8A1L9V5_AJEC8|nr:peptidase inhibitor I78 family protein, nitrosative stress-induced transcript [Histoplasma capsulatum var. duboisii H88]